VLSFFVYPALQSASYRHKPCRIRTSGHSPRFDRNHPQPPSRNLFTIRTSGIHLCNPFVIRTSEKKGGETRRQATHSIYPFPSLFCTLVSSNSRAISGLSALCRETPGVGGLHSEQPSEQALGLYKCRRGAEFMSHSPESSHGGLRFRNGRRRLTLVLVPATTKHVLQVWQGAT